jgi:predicted PurR-regulated permease PerM
LVGPTRRAGFIPGFAPSAQGKKPLVSPINRASRANRDGEYSTLAAMNTNRMAETERTGYGKKALIQAGAAAFVILGVVLVWKAAEVFLLIFAGVLLAVFLHSVIKWINQKTGLPEKWSLACILLVLVLAVAGGIWFIAPEVSSQMDRLTQRIPEAVDQAQQRILKYEWIKNLLAQKEPLEKMVPDGSDIVSTTARIFTSTFGAVGNLLIFLAIGIFLAINPRTYIDGLVRLAPKTRRLRAREVLQAMGSALESWLLAKIAAMLVVGVLTAAGLWLIGIELVLLLGLLAAILTFIPNIGPILALVPAALLAMLQGPDKIIYVVSLYAGIQTLESYVITPFLQQSMADLPPALIIGMQILLGVLVGGLGLILATPLTAAGMVFVKMVYIEDILGDHRD